MTENNQFEQINDYFHHLKGTDYSPLYFPHFSKLIATMIKHMFIIIFSGIVLMDTDLACECNGIVLWDESTNKNFGECKRKTKGHPWCYVNRNSGCSDIRHSRRSVSIENQQYHWSTEACSQGGKIFKQYGFKYHSSCIKYLVKLTAIP